MTVKSFPSSFPITAADPVISCLIILHAKQKTSDIPEIIEKEENQERHLHIRTPTSCRNSVFFLFKREECSLQQTMQTSTWSFVVMVLMYHRMSNYKLEALRMELK
jgi:hypothetical protein